MLHCGVGYEKNVKSSSIHLSGSWHALGLLSPALVPNGSDYVSLRIRSGTGEVVGLHGLILKSLVCVREVQD